MSAKLRLALYRAGQQVSGDMEMEWVANMERALMDYGFAVVPLKATIAMHNAASFSDGRARPPVAAIGDGGLLFIDWQNADFSRMYDAAIAARPRVDDEESAECSWVVSQFQK